MVPLIPPHLSPHASSSIRSIIRCMVRGIPLTNIAMSSRSGDVLTLVEILRLGTSILSIAKEVAEALVNLRRSSTEARSCFSAFNGRAHVDA